ncbi:MAG: FAD:protein FMN transferase [Candidatus Pacebacteria bacterium]|nr:FAD:protein FMN transferase [Candidatus Paceibacterota bacterium]
MTQFNFEGIGTKWQVDIPKTISEAEEQKILSLIKNRIDVFDRAYSRFRDDSIVMKMSKESGVFILPEDAKPLMELYYDLYKQTDGFFTPLIGNMLSDAGYDAKYSLQQKNKLKEVLRWEEVISYEYPNIQMKQPAILDFGAGGKGYLVDIIGSLLEENNIDEYFINAGGDILHKGKKSIRVGLENPENINQVVGVYTLQNRSICGSAGNRRTWGDFTHIMNPKTLSSQKNILAVWVVAETALLADSLATCLFFVEADTLKNFYKFEYILIRNDLSVEKSTNNSLELFTE